MGSALPVVAQPSEAAQAWMYRRIDIRADILRDNPSSAEASAALEEAIEQAKSWYGMDIGEEGVVVAKKETEEQQDSRYKAHILHSAEMANRALGALAAMQTEIGEAKKSAKKEQVEVPETVDLLLDLLGSQRESVEEARKILYTLAK